MKLLLILIMSSLIVSCANYKTTNGIPNLETVSPGIWRGGQPTVAGWVYLQSIGVSNSVKLNLEPENNPASVTVHAFPITTWQQIFGNGLSNIVASASASIVPGTFVHCEFGRNRTGTVIGYYRLQCGWKKADAEEEMNHYGWGNSLPGLKQFWYSQCHEAR